MSSRRWIAAGGLGAAALAVTAVVAASSGGGSTATADASAVATATAKIERRDLVESEKVDGTLEYADSRTVTNRLDGTVTWLPTDGSVVAAGHRLYDVDGRGVYLLDGRTPAWRTLQRGESGRDVGQLERNLRVLHLDPGHAMSVDGSWDSGTTAAVKRWQRRKGLPQTGLLEVGRVVFQPGRRRVAVGAATLGGSAAASGGGSAGTPGAASTATQGAGDNGAADARVSTTGAVWHGRRPATASIVFSAGDHATTGPTGSTGPTGPTGATGPAATATPPSAPEAAATGPGGAEGGKTARGGKPPSRSQAAAPSPASPGGGRGAPAGGAGTAGGGSSAPAAAGSDAAAAGSSAQAAPANALLTTTSTRQIVSVALKTSKVALARLGSRVTVELPSGDDAVGRLATIGSVATKATGSNADTSDATIDVTVELRSRTAAAGLDQAPVSVRLERSRRRDVLAVPVTALQAESGGGFAVELRDGGRRRVVPVRVGLYTSGYVEISADGLHEGQSVSDAAV